MLFISSDFGVDSSKFSSKMSNKNYVWRRRGEGSGCQNSDCECMSPNPPLGTTPAEINLLDSCLLLVSSILGHLLINPAKMSVRPPAVRPYVCTSTMKHNAATNQIVIFVKVDETFTTIWLSRLSEVRVKVTWDLKFQKWRFSNSISSAIFQPIRKIPTVFDTRPIYLKSLRPDF